MNLQVLIDSLDTARFACPECHREKIIQLSEYNIKRQITKVRCKCRCGHTYMVTLEKKIESTPDTQLLGTFISRGRIKCSGKMIIKKLNNKGLMLRTNIEQNILPGLKLFLEFVLDDAKQSIVKKEVVVKAKNGKYLSAEFISDEHYDNLGPYLFFNKLYI
jgi:6-pyruvoyl-tetrahydropterin synthase